MACCRFDSHRAQLTRRQALRATAVGLLFAPRIAQAASADLAVIVHPSNDASHLDAADLEAIFTVSRRYWSGSRVIIAFNHPPKTAPRVQFDRAVLHMDPDEVARYWIDRKVRGGRPPPRRVSDSDLLVRLVAKLKGAIGYVPISKVSGKVKVVARVTGGGVRRAPSPT